MRRKFKEGDKVKTKDTGEVYEVIAFSNIRQSYILDLLPGQMKAEIVDKDIAEDCFVKETTP